MSEVNNHRGCCFWPFSSSTPEEREHLTEKDPNVNDKKDDLGATPPGTPGKKTVAKGQQINKGDWD